MRVAFWLLQDSIQQWSNWIAGLHYVQHCLESLAVLDESNIPEVVAFLPASLRDKFMESAICQSASWLRVVEVDERLLQDRVGLQRLEELVASHRCDLFFPMMTPPVVPVTGKIVAWIADYQHLHYPNFFTADDLAYRDKLFSFLTCIADRVVCSSGTVQTDLKQFYPLAESRSFVLRFTVQPPATVLEERIDTTLEKFSIDAPYAYLPYQFWSHKNHQVVFQAWKELKGRGKNYNLICTGAKLDGRNPEHFRSLENYLKKYQLEDSVRILGIVDRRDQWQLYRGANLVLQPSLFEGWSTSIEEARSLGKSIVLSDIPVHREQLGESGHFFSPLDSHGLADLIQKIWDRRLTIDREMHEKAAVEAHRDRVRCFGEQLIALFRDAMAECREPIGSQVLPLFSFYKSEAQARLAVIEGLSARLNPSAHKLTRPSRVKTARNAWTGFSGILTKACGWAGKVFQ